MSSEAHMTNWVESLIVSVKIIRLGYQASPCSHYHLTNIEASAWRSNKPSRTRLQSGPLAGCNPGSPEFRNLARSVWGSLSSNSHDFFDFSRQTSRPTLSAVNSDKFWRKLACGVTAYAWLNENDVLYLRNALLIEPLFIVFLLQYCTVLACYNKIVSKHTVILLWDEL